MSKVKQKNVMQWLTAKKLGGLTAAKVKNALNGKKVKFDQSRENESGHGYDVNLVYEIGGNSIVSGYGNTMMINNLINPSAPYGGGSVYLYELILSETSTEEELKNELTSLDAIIEDCQRSKAVITSKIEFLTETKSKTFDPSAFSSYMINKIIASDLSVEEKTKQIEQILA